MIRFLIDTTVKARDVHGNCYNFSKITSTKTGKSLFVDSGWGSDGGNIKSKVKRAANLDFSELSYTESLEKARRFNEIHKYTTFAATHESALTDEMVLDLEK